MSQECDWCGILIEGQEVQHFDADPELEGHYHPGCFGMLKRFTDLLAAVKATGWTRTEFMMNVELLAQELPEEPQILTNVTFTNFDEDVVTTDVRINVTNEVRNLESKVPCPNCGVENWVIIGTDPGEYRCIRCTMWL